MISSYNSTRLFVFNCIAFVFHLNLFCQNNLVPNSSFETYTACPVSEGQLSNAAGWTIPNSCTTDYFNVCGSTSFSVPNNLCGSQNARTGDAYVGFFCCQFPILDVREYLQIQLSQTLSPKQYQVTFYVCLAENSGYSVKTIGAHFSNTIVASSFCSPIQVVPQVLNSPSNSLNSKTQWTKIQGIYNASGGESYLTIGNFNSDQTSDTVFVGNGDIKSYYYLDDVSVVDFSLVDIAEYSESKKYAVSPNPVSDRSTITFQNPSNDKYTFTLYDVSGSVVKTINDITSNEFQIPKDNLPKGLYHFSLFSQGEGFYGKLLID